jgi:hypothetical protein
MTDPHASVARGASMAQRVKRGMSTLLSSYALAGDQGFECVATPAGPGALTADECRAFDADLRRTDRPIERLIAERSLRA